MTGYINPKVLAIPSPQGLDLALERLRAALGNVAWLEVVFGRAILQHTAGENGVDVTYPEVWGENREPLNVMPNDNLNAYSFIVARDPATIQGFESLDTQVFISQPISIVIWANLLKIDSNRNYRFSEELKADLLQKIIKVSSFTLQNFYESYGKVFEGFTITDTYKTFLKPPYWALRIDGAINYAGLPENCRGGDFNNDYNKDFYK